jgi:hypothetical protein
MMTEETSQIELLGDGIDEAEDVSQSKTFLATAHFKLNNLVYSIEYQYTETHNRAGSRILRTFDFMDEATLSREGDEDFDPTTIDYLLISGMLEQNFKD